MDVYKAKKISSGSKTWLQKWRHKRDKINVFLAYYEVTLDASKKAVQTFAVDGEDYVTFNVVLTDRGALFNKSESRVSKSECEDLADDAILATVRELKDKGFRVSFKKEFGNVNNYYNITVDWKNA